MVLQYYKLKEQPFGVTPDPRFLYASGTHREALSSLLYGVESKLGFLALTAKPGMGKTTLLFATLEKLGPATKTVFLFQSISSPVDLMIAILLDLGITDIKGGLVELQTRLHEELVRQAAAGKRLVLVIDEAQNLDESILELVRMLSNFETSRYKLMQIILAGQPQLDDKLNSPDRLQLRQRISIFARLHPFTAAETAAYVDHRLRVAGYSDDAPLFSKLALDLIARYSEGIPRNINNICFNAMSIGCALQRETIDADVIREVIGDLGLERAETTPVMAASNEPQSVAASTNSIASKKPLEPLHTDERMPLSFQAVTSGRSSNRWWLGAGIAAGVALLAGALWFADRHASSMPATGQTTAGDAKTTQAASTPIPGATAQTSEQASDPSVKWVEVQTGQTLNSICNESIGNCSPEMLAEIVHENPGISDPDHILPGQKIRVPAALAVSNGNSSTLSAPAGSGQLSAGPAHAERSPE